MEAEYQPQDTYANGVDLVRLISNEFGSSPAVVRPQLVSAKIELDGKPYESDNKLFIPYDIAKGKEIVVIGPDRHWRVQFNG